jgi:hypothetical protein
MSRFCGELSAVNGANGMSDIEGKAERIAANECGQRVSFNWWLGLASAAATRAKVPSESISVFGKVSTR